MLSDIQFTDEYKRRGKVVELKFNFQHVSKPYEDEEEHTRAYGRAYIIVNSKTELNIDTVRVFEQYKYSLSDEEKAQILNQCVECEAMQRAFKQLKLK